MKADDGEKGGRNGYALQWDRSRSNLSRSSHVVRCGQHRGRRGKYTGYLRGPGMANVLRHPVRLTRNSAAAAALASAFAHFHAALFVLAHLDRGVDIGRANREQHEQRQEMFGECSGGHVQETRHVQDSFHLYHTSRRKGNPHTQISLTDMFPREQVGTLDEV